MTLDGTVALMAQRYRWDVTIERASVGMVRMRGRRGRAAEDRKWESDEACVEKVEQDACGTRCWESAVVRTSISLVAWGRL